MPKLSKVKQDRVNDIKKEVKFIDCIVIGILVFLLLFVVSIMILAFINSYEPTTLIVSVFGFCGLECGLMSYITNKKNTLKKEADKILNPDKNKDSTEENKGID